MGNVHVQEVLDRRLQDAQAGTVSFTINYEIFVPQGQTLDQVKDSISGVTTGGQEQTTLLAEFANQGVQVASESIEETIPPAHVSVVLVVAANGELQAPASTVENVEPAPTPAPTPAPGSSPAPAPANTAAIVGGVIGGAIGLIIVVAF